MALPDYLQDSAKDFARQLTASTSVPINTGTFTGRSFVAGEDPLQTAAITAATQGLGSYQPYLTQAQTLTGTGMPTPAGVTPGSIQDFMSPYQGAVIDETLRQYDLSRDTGRRNIQDAAVDAGAFGGGREGALLGQYDADTLANRAGLQAQLLQSGFQDAARRRADAFTQQQALAGARAGLANQQFGLSNFQRQNLAGDVANLGQLGAFRQGLDQSQLTADQQALQTAAYEPFQRLDRFGAGITSLAGGVGGQQFQAPAAPSPFSTALSTALGIGGLFGKFK